MFLNSYKYNKFDVYIFVMLASLTSGDLLGALQIPRVLALLFFIPFVKSIHSADYELNQMKKWTGVFLTFSFFSCLWNPAGIIESLIASTYNLVHVILFLEIIFFSRFAENPIKSIIYGILVTFLISAAIAFWEITTDYHLSTSRMEEAYESNTGFEVYLRKFTSVTFFNFNAYVTFLCYLLPFLFYGFFSKQNNLKIRIIFLASTLIAIVLILYNGSRGGLLSFVIMFTVYITLSKKNKANVFFIIFFLSLLTIVLYSYGSTIFNALLMRASVQGALEEESRIVIWTNVYKVIQDYCFIGCGAGGLMSAMEDYAQGGILKAHNIFLEVLSEYGIVFFILFVSFLISQYKKARKMDDRERKLCLFQALIAFPVIGIINSGYQTQPALWAFLAVIYVFANYEQIRLSCEDLCITA